MESPQASAAAARTFEIPPHVPAELVRSIGLTDGPEFLAAPHVFMADLHNNQPRIFYNTSQHMPGSWLLTNYDDAYFVLRHPEIFTTAGATPFPRDPNNYFYFIPLEIDPPDHRKYRAILDPMLSPKSIALLEGKIRDMANGLIDQFIAKGECEFTKDFGRPLPVLVFLDLMGLPHHMLDTFVGWAMGLLHAQDRKIAETSMREACAYLATVIKEKAQQPDDGVISKIVHGAARRRGDDRPGDFRLHLLSVHRRPRHGVRDAQQHLPVAGRKSRTAARKSSIRRTTSTPSSKSCCGSTR
jgi:cytochrome P450